MNTYRNTVSSVLVAAMSMYACVLLSEAPAYAQQAAVVYKSQSAGFALDNPHTPDAQSKRYVALNKQPLEQLIYKGLSVSPSDREVLVNFSMPREIFCALLSKYLSSN
jgi:hypothetical protein